MAGITLDSNYEVAVKPQRDRHGLITQGVVLGDTTYQRVRMIIEAQKGEFKEYPTLGFGIDNWLRGTRSQTAQRFVTELEKELRTDGLRARVLVNNNDIRKFEVKML